MASLPGRDYFAVCPLVPAVSAQLPRSGGDDARARIAYRSHHAERERSSQWKAISSIIQCKQIRYSEWWSFTQLPFCEMLINRDICELLSKYTMPIGGGDPLSTFGQVVIVKEKLVGIACVVNFAGRPNRPSLLVGCQSLPQLWTCAAYLHLTHQQFRWNLRSSDLPPAVKRHRVRNFIVVLSIRPFRPIQLSLKTQSKWLRSQSH